VLIVQYKTFIFTFSSYVVLRLLKDLNSTDVSTANVP